MRKIVVVRGLCVGLLSVGIGAAAASVREVVVIKNGRVLPMSGPAIEGGVVIVEDGKITARRKGPRRPGGRDGHRRGRRLGAPRAHRGPHDDRAPRTEFGPSNSDELSDPVTAQLLVLDALNPFDKRLKHAREAGITAALVTPGRGNVIGGQAAVVRLGGQDRRGNDHSLARRGQALARRGAEGRVRREGAPALDPDGERLRRAQGPPRGGRVPEEEPRTTRRRKRRPREGEGGQGRGGGARRRSATSPSSRWPRSSTGSSRRSSSATGRTTS